MKRLILICLAALVTLCTARAEDAPLFFPRLPVPSDLEIFQVIGQPANTVKGSRKQELSAAVAGEFRAVAQKYLRAAFVPEKPYFVKNMLLREDMPDDAYGKADVAYLPLQLDGFEAMLVSVGGPQGSFALCLSMDEAARAAYADGTNATRMTFACYDKYFIKDQAQPFAVRQDATSTQGLVMLHATESGTVSNHLSAFRGIASGQGLIMVFPAFHYVDNGDGTIQARLPAQVVERNEWFAMRLISWRNRVRPQE